MSKRNQKRPQEISERVGRNPKTMEEFVIPESMKPVFRPSKALRDTIAAYASSQKETEPGRNHADISDLSDHDNNAPPSDD